MYIFLLQSTIVYSNNDFSIRIFRFKCQKMFFFSFQIFIWRGVCTESSESFRSTKNTAKYCRWGDVTFFFFWVRFLLSLDITNCMWVWCHDSVEASKCYFCRNHGGFYRQSKRALIHQNMHLFYCTWICVNYVTIN